MGATAVNKKLNIIDKTSTIREIQLYSDVTNFIDYDNGGYFSVYDGTAYRYAYCSSHLYTNSKGNPTSYLICKFIGKDGNLRYMYTRQPDETEELYKTITSDVSNTILISQEDNRSGCCFYLVNTKGSNGNKGTAGGAGIVTTHDKYGKPTGGRDGSCGFGGAGGSAGVSVTSALTLDDGSGNTLSIAAGLDGMCGAGGGGGGGAGTYINNNTTSGAPGGAGGTANNVSKAYKVRIRNGFLITGNVQRYINSDLSGKKGEKGQTGYKDDNDGGMGGASGDGQAGMPGGDGSARIGGAGGKGGDAGSSRVGYISGTGTVKVLDIANFDSYANGFSNSIASTGGVVITKIIGSFPD